MSVRTPSAAILALLVTIVPVAASAQALKVGVFDKQRIVDESKLGVAAKGRFEKIQGERETEVATKQKAFEALQQAYDQKASVLSEDKRLEMQRDIARSRDELQSSAANADRDLQRAYQTALMEIVGKVDPIIDEYGKANGYDLLFDRQQCAFAKQALDVTADIITKINAAHPQG